MQAKTIQEVIDILEVIIQDSIKEESTLGYFAALYQNVTVAVKEKIGQNYFENDKRMELLDITFANRYLAAYTEFKAKKPSTKSWQVAFDESTNRRLIVLQHLLLGMNAHINLDLGIAAGEVTTPENIHDLKSDFNKINILLASLVAEVENDLAEIWPTLLKILKYFKKIDDFLVNFSMSVARDEAWRFANKIVGTSGAEKEALIKSKDQKVANFSNRITGPGFFVSSILLIISFCEKGSIADRIRYLERKSI